MKAPNEILYFADSPTSVERKIPLDQFEMMTGMQWTDTNLVEDANHQQVAKRPNLIENPRLFAKINDDIKAHKSSLMVVDMNHYGYAVFARKDIPADTYVTNRTGTIVFHQKADINERDVHSISLYLNQVIMVSEKFGNISRFIPQLSRIENIKGAYSFNGDVELGQIATANLKLISYLQNNSMCTAYRTLSPIPAGTLVGCDYMQENWCLIKSSPPLFYKNGQILPKNLYLPDYTTLYISYKDDNYTAEYTFSRETLAACRRQKTIKLSHENNVLKLPGKVFDDSCRLNPHSFFHSFVDMSNESVHNKKSVVESESLVASSKEIEAELNRISSTFNLPAWSYSINTKRAFLSTPDKLSLIHCGEYLKKQGCQVGFGPRNTIIVFSPELDKLKNIAKIEENQGVVFRV